MIMTDQELKDLVASLAINSAKADARLEKADARLAKTDAQLAETDAQLAKTVAQMAKTDIRIDKVFKMYGGASNNHGAIAEEFYFNSLKHNPTLNGIKFDHIDKNITRSKGGIEDEYDIVMINGKDIFLIEVKYKAHENDLTQLLEEKSPNFDKLYPEYNGYNKHLGLASFHINDDIKKQAFLNKVTILQRKGDIIETIPA
ncbi:hypothetical protein SPONL_95 [uncultured Candidatus Thioglobus sp.]|nr:hypothetical protein SPONL_95 [uncultured Candidatus Thioglobus sp.]